MTSKKLKPPKRHSVPPLLEEKKNALGDWNTSLRLWKEAKRGNCESARLLLLVFCNSVDEGCANIPKPVLCYLRSAFLRYLNGDASIERALHLARPKHRPKGTHRKHADPLRMAALFFLYTERDGLKATAAKNKVASNCYTTRRSVDAAVKLNRDLQLLATPATRRGRPAKRSFAELEALAEDTDD